MRIAVTLLTLLSTATALAQELPIKDPQYVTLQDLAFISGHSRGEYDGGIADEHWSEPGGDSIMGVSRYIKSAKVQKYQLMVIEQTPKGPSLRVMDFKPGLDPWEEKAHVVIYALIRWTKGEAVFERQDKSARLTYRTAGNGVLESVVERPGHKTELRQFTHSSE